MPKIPYLYQHHTWVELGEIAKEQPVVVLPIGSVEDHGPHLPLDVDNFLIWSICEEAAKRAAGDILLMPIIPFGFETHHMDFPGTIDIQMEHLLHFVLDVTRSVAHHGFRRILIADGHGSNMPILELVARRTIIETPALCAAFLWPSLALGEIKQIRESGRSGMSHACELETSVYLYLDGGRVQMDKALKETNQPPSDFIWNDLLNPGPIRMMDWWTCFSKSGINGDPTLATAAKGEIVFEAVVANFVKLAREFKSRPDGQRTDWHKEQWPG